MRSPKHAQSGVTLLVTLVMLVMLTLFALSAMNTSTTNLRMVGNMQARSEALGASQATIEATISTAQFASTPSNAIPVPCDLPNQMCFDINGDGTMDLITALIPQPTCAQARAIKVSELKINTPTSEDLACVQAQQQGTFAVAGAAPTGNSLCGQTVWDVTAQTKTYNATFATTDVHVTVTQGIGIRIPELDLATSCP